MNPAQSLSRQRDKSKMSKEDLRFDKIVEVLDEQAEELSSQTARIQVLEGRVNALVSLVEFLVDNLVGDEDWQET